MKVFNFTNGKKSELLADVGAWRGTGDGLVNGVRVQDFRGFEFHNSFEVKTWEAKETVVITPADFAARFGKDVEAVCFCIGHNLTLDVWEWCFCASPAWLTKHGITGTKHVTTVEELIEY
jgi:hypothetical protein